MKTFRPGAGEHEPAAGWEDVLSESHMELLTEAVLLGDYTPLIEGYDTHFVDLENLINIILKSGREGMNWDEIDELAAETAASFATMHPDYAYLSSRLARRAMYRNTNPSMLATVRALSEYIDPESKLHAPLIAPDTMEVIESYSEIIETTIDHKRDDNYDIFGLRTLQRSYLLKMYGEIAERPQHMLMRVAIGIHGDDIEQAMRTYDLMSSGLFTHATPTLFNAGTPFPQMSSCFLLTMKDDSLNGIYDTLKQCAQISKSAGGIGLSIHQIRAEGSYIKGTNGTSNGLVPMLRVFNDTARYVDQGGGKRKGVIAVYLEPWHADIYKWLDLKKPHGKEESRARDLFYALWASDLFMKRVEDNAQWSLFCPNECPGLHEVWGDEFEELYLQYEEEGKAREVVSARHLWDHIVTIQIETGTPYMLYKDAANAKSNQQNLGTIQSSNLCTEIMEFTSPEEVAVCNLASIALPKFIDVDAGTYDFEELHKITRQVTYNLNAVIDRNYYPVPEARTSNLRHRPIGIGVQGLADTFALLKMDFESEDAKTLNRHIFETIYHASITESVELAKRDGPYETFAGSPASEGKLQFDMWGVVPDSGRWDWGACRSDVIKYGMRNSLLVAPMPTASTSQILGNNECFEAFTSNAYVRRTLAGEFQVINKHLVRDLIEAGLWSEDMKDKIIWQNGSIKDIAAIPKDIRQRYKTTWEISQRAIIEMSADRGAYIDQSQSLNIHMTDATTSKVTSMHFTGWRAGLKTGMYYLRTKAATNAIKFTHEQKMRTMELNDDSISGLIDRTHESENSLVCRIDDDECDACGA